MRFTNIFALSFDRLDTGLLAQSDWAAVPVAIPILAGAYGFHNVIPSIVAYLNKDRAKVKCSILLGTGIPMIVYALWLGFTLGTIPLSSLEAAGRSGGIPIIDALFAVTQSLHLKTAAFGFTAFAIATSLLGVSFSMVDFLADATKVKAVGRARAVLSLITIIPPMLIAYFYPNLFVKVFGYAAGFGESILNGLFPISVMWITCYKLKLRGAQAPMGGRATLVGMIVFTLMILAIETYGLFKS